MLQLALRRTSSGPTVAALSAKPFYNSLDPFPLSAWISHLFWNRQYWTLKITEHWNCENGLFYCMIFQESLILKSLSRSWTTWVLAVFRSFSTLQQSSCRLSASNLFRDPDDEAATCAQNFSSNELWSCTQQRDPKWGEPRLCLIRTSESSNQKAPCTLMDPKAFLKFWFFFHSFILQGTPVYSTLEPYSEYELTISYKACQLYSFWRKLSHLHRQSPEKHNKTSSAIQEKCTAYSVYTVTSCKTERLEDEHRQILTGLVTSGKGVAMCKCWDDWQPSSTPSPCKGPVRQSSELFEYHTAHKLHTTSCTQCS